MKILVINTGSSSIKFKLFELPQEQELLGGTVEKIGEKKGSMRYMLTTPTGEKIEEQMEEAFTDYRSGLHKIAEVLFKREYGLLNNPEDIQVVGHRVVHGGERFSQPVRINDQVLQQIEALVPLAPLHNPPNLEGIKVSYEIFPAAQQMAVFDTAFHQTLPSFAYRYAIPHHFYEKHQVRVYGMHGTSHQYVAQQAAHYLERPLQNLHLITVHLGNGCSMTAIKEGKSFDTSMGFSPLAGLVMGTRSGDIDPAVIFYMGRRLQMSMDEIDQTLNKQSGLKGLAHSNDLRDIIQREAEGEQEAKQALELYTYRIKKYLGAYYAALGKVDAIIFTAGVGENSPLIRARSCAGLERLGILIDPAKNAAKTTTIREIQQPNSAVKILVIPTNEELAIAREAYELVQTKQSD